MSELKPCPFCGGEAYVVWYDEDYTSQGDFATVRCSICGASRSAWTDVESAIERWNTREEHTCHLVKDDCYWRCTECRDMFLTELDIKPKYRYCPNCGAKVVNR